MREFTILHLFSGLGGAALGFKEARASWRGVQGKFRCLGGIDNSAEACEDFEALTGSKATCADIHSMTTAEMLAASGGEAPDVIFTSPPCKGYSGLLASKLAKTEKYQALNRLVLEGINLILTTWPATPPKLIILENVPRIQNRGHQLLIQLRALLGQAGYVFHEGTHDCGVLGGLAQHRRRYLMIARHEKQLPVFVYQPPTQKVMSIGSVLERLPMPGAPEMGRLHRIPSLMWRTWVRLALIHAGKDWRDLKEFAPKDPAARRRWEKTGEKTPGETHKFGGAFAIMPWDQAARTVIGGPSNGACFVQDPRVGMKEGRPNLFGVLSWDEPAKTVTGSASVSGSNGVAAVADPRLNKGRKPFNNVWKVHRFDEPSGAVTGGTGPSSSAICVGDTRLGHSPRGGSLRVVAFDESTPTVTGAAGIGRSNAFGVADPRLGCKPRSGVMGVTRWEDPAATITGSADIHQSAVAVADPRDYKDTDKPNPPPVIISLDGTWHRPLTTLELAALQGLPMFMPDGRPLTLAGGNDSRHRERIGNAVPAPAAQAVGESMLLALLPNAEGLDFVFGGTPIWVEPADVPRSWS